MSKQSDIQSLVSLVSSQQALLNTFLTNLAPNVTEAPSTDLPPNPPNPLHLLRDAATLLKAHITKLSLLLINKPFTATAIQKVVRDVSGTCLPAIMGAVELCQPDVWGSFLRQQVIGRVRTVMREMDLCYNETKQIALEELEALGQGKGKSSAKQDQGRDSLVSTGVVWEACDRIIELDSVGIAGLAVKRAEEWRDMIKDAIEELKEWEDGDGEDDDEEDDAAASDNDDDDDDKDSVDDMFSAANALPKNRPDLKEQLATANDKLKKIGMLYTALAKRRLKTFTPDVAATKANIHSLDELLNILKTLPDSVDDLASAFYDLDSDEVEQVMTKCIQDARKAAELAKLSWDAKDDEFTAWATKWLEVMK